MFAVKTRGHLIHTSEWYTCCWQKTGIYIDSKGSSGYLQNTSRHHLVVSSQINHPKNDKKGAVSVAAVACGILLAGRLSLETLMWMGSLAIFRCPGRILEDQPHKSTKKLVIKKLVSRSSGSNIRVLYWFYIIIYSIQHICIYTPHFIFPYGTCVIFQCGINRKQIQ